jgi:hypothetical protein
MHGTKIRQLLDQLDCKYVTTFNTLLIIVLVSFCQRDCTGTVFWEVFVYDNTRYQTIRNLIISIPIFPASAINYMLLVVSPS